jgi:beta-galactosidase
MNFNTKLSTAFFLACSLVFVSHAAARERLLMDFGWRFHLGSLTDMKSDFDFGAGNPWAKAGNAVGAVKPDFNDKDWREIDLPHDWAIELPFDQTTDKSHGFKPIGRKFPDTTVGWYRRSFNIPKSDLGKRLSLEFDGVFRDCIVWLNGHVLGRHDSGYSSFQYDITDCVNYGGKNTLVLRVDATHFEGWFYEGAGIYRHVWLTKTDPLHVAHWGTYVTSEVKENEAVVTARTRVVNESDQEAAFDLVSKVQDSDGKLIATNIASQITLKPWEEREIAPQLTLKNPRLWSPDSPNLYKLLTSIKQGNNETDLYETVFGVRTIRFDPDKGFFLNGKPVYIKGTCNHQDHAGVGAALPDRIQYYRIEKLKEMGSNAYRSSHNAPTPELLDACDRLGMLVMDEHRTMGSSPEILGQLERMVLRDRNHPSIIMWSLGNEEHIQGSDAGERVARNMKRLVDRLDPTRPVTAAMNGAWGKGFSKVVDIQGCNYLTRGNFDAYHKEHPAQPIISSEEASTVSTRGIYANDKAKGYLAAYDQNKPGWGKTAEDWWTYFQARPYIMGAFVWTGFDYRGEPTPYGWPCISSHFGIIDTCGFPKDNFYYYQSQWTDKTVLHLLPHWNWPGKEGQEIDVWCHSNCDEVELFLNAQSLGRKKMPENSHLEWKVKYAPGTLIAKGFKDGKEIATAKTETAGEPAAVKLAPDRATIQADGEDVAMVAVSVVDAQGRLVPTADNEVTFEVGPNARIIGVGNGDPSSHESDKAAKRKTFNGLCMVIVQSSKNAGEIKLTARSPGLSDATIIIKSESCPLRPTTD